MWSERHLITELVCGAINWDTSIFVDSFPNPGEEAKAKKVIGVPGGKGANVAVASARILGSGVGIIGALGNDHIAEKQIKILHEEGIDTSCIKRIVGTSSGQAYILVDEKGENLILTYKAANHMITADMVNDDNTVNAIKSSKLITVIDPPLEVAEALISNGKSHGKMVIWSPAMLARHGFDSLKELLLKADYVIVNESESSLLSAADDATKACLTLSNNLNGKKVITTLGREGCVFCWQTKTARIPALDLSSLDLHVINTVGAGDAFVGSYAALKTKGFDDVEALFMANIAGSLKTTKEETRGSPRYDEIKHYLDDQRVQSLFAKINVV
ncbi:MAG: PfkB family carbohydrate kinase [Nitrososphaerales archaeon]